MCPQIRPIYSCKCTKPAYNKEQVFQVICDHARFNNIAMADCPKDGPPIEYQDPSVALCANCISKEQNDNGNDNGDGKTGGQDQGQFQADQATG
jgi:hypothetical protein